jgi:hypothetical protein
MVVLENKSLKLLLLHQTESLVKLMTLIKKVETTQMKKKAVKQEDTGMSQSEELEDFQSLKENILERALETHVASYRLAVERLQNKINEEYKKYTGPEDSLSEENFDWDQIDLEKETKDDEIKEEINTKLDMISSYFFDVVEDNDTIPLSVGVLKKIEPEDRLASPEKEQEMEEIEFDVPEVILG